MITNTLVTCNAAKACDLLSNTNLSKLMQANLSAIAFDDDSITRGDLERIDSKFCASRRRCRYCMAHYPQKG